jgi:hypothetical protein
VKGRLRKINGGEYDQSTSYSCLEIAQWNPFVQLIHITNKKIKA